MQELRQSTEIKVRIGCAMDATDGVTPETSLDLGAADQAELLKHNGAATVDISGNTFAAITGCDGWYDLTLTTSNTNTLGQLTVVIQDSSLMTPIFRDFMVVTQNYWDSKYSTDKLQVDVTQIEGVDATDQIRDSIVDDATRIDASALNTHSAITAASIVDEWETQSQADPTGFHVNVKEVNGTAQTANDNSADINLILEDTNDLQTNQNNWLTATGFSTHSAADVRIEIDSNSTQLNDIKTKIDTVIADITALNDISVADIISGIADGAYDAQEMLRLIFSAVCCKTSGGGTTTLKSRDSADSKDRITLTVDANGNRITSTLDGS